MKKIILASLALGAIMSAGAQVNRELVLTDKEGNTITYPADQVDGILFQAQPEYIQMNEVFDASYEEVGSLGIYGLSMATHSDYHGNPAGAEDLVARLLFAAPYTDDIQNPKLPAGYYRIGRSDAEWTFDVTKSAITVLDENGNPTPSMIIGGTVDVRYDEEENYDIRVELVMFTGATVDLRYQGKIAFPAGYGGYQPFTEPVDIAFTNGQGRFYGNWYYPFAADMMLQFFEGTIEDSVLKEGYVLEITMYEPKPENEMAPNQRVADGVYTIETRDAVAYTYLPFRYEGGKREDFMGTEYIVKTRLNYYGADGSRKLGLIRGGTFTVSNNGSNFVFDFVTEEGISITGTYTSAPWIQNFCDNNTSAPERPYSTLTENVQLNWEPGTIGMSYNEGPSILDNLNTMIVMIVHPSQTVGDYIEFDFFTDSEDLPDGEFTIGEGLEANHVIPGAVDFGRQMIFSWYGDLGSYDPEEGYHTKLAPLTTGTITISTLANGERKIVFNAKDDADHEITGEYSGVIINANEMDDARAKNIRKSKSFNKRVMAPRK